VEHVALLRNGLLCFSSYFESAVAVPRFKNIVCQWCRNRIIPNKLLKILKTLFSRAVHSNAESSNTQYMPYSLEIFDRTVYDKCLVRETGTVLRTRSPCVHREDVWRK